MTNEAKSGFAIWVLPPEGGRVLKFSFSIAKLSLVAFIVGTALGGLFVVLGDYSRMQSRSDESSTMLDSVRKEHARLLDENKKLSGVVAQMKGSHGEVLAYENKIRERLNTLAALLKDPTAKSSSRAVITKAEENAVASKKGRAVFSYSDGQPRRKKDVALQKGMGGPELDCARIGDASCIKLLGVSSAMEGEGSEPLRELLGDGVRGIAQGDILLVLDQVITLIRSVPLLSPSGGSRTSGFGFRVSPFHSGLKLHEGLDFAVDRGSPIYAPGDGVVEVVDSNSTYGIYVDIRHNDRIVTRYAHMDRALVKEGQSLHRGDRIGLVGSTGRSTGPHLHYEVRVDGKAKNPEVFLALSRKISKLL